MSTARITGSKPTMALSRPPTLSCASSDDGTSETEPDSTMTSNGPSADKPLAPSRGQMMDHVGLSVTNLDAWVAKLKAENVKFLQQPYKVGDYRAVMIEGPSREAIELIEVK